MSTRQLQSIHAYLFAGLVLVICVAALTRARSFTPPPVQDELIDGRVAHAFEAHYDDAFPVRKFGISLWAALDYVLFHEARSGVVIGKDDWLYTDEEFVIGSDASRELLRNFALINWARTQLAERQVRLLMAIVPSKARVYPEHLGRRTPPTLHRDLYRRVQDQFEATRLPSADLLPALTEGKATQPTYLRTDTHWTPHGARLAAAKIAVAVDQLRTPPASPTVFEIKSDGTRTHRGDLYNFLPLDPYFAFLLPPPDTLDVVTTERAGDAGGGDLLGDAVAPRIALVGTSYSAEPQWNFVGALEHALGEDVGNYSKEGVGPFAPMFEYLRSEDFRRAPPKLVIWEIPERYLVVHQPLDDYRLPPEAFKVESPKQKTPLITASRDE